MAMDMKMKFGLFALVLLWSLANFLEDVFTTTKYPLNLGYNRYNHGEESENNIKIDLEPFSSNETIELKEPWPLLPDLIPTHVHFVLCDQMKFDFILYLSIESAIRALQPRSVTLHGGAQVLQDRHRYHLWLDELKRDHPLFIVKKEDNNLKHICGGYVDSKRNGLVALLRKKGGIYVGMRTWLLDIPLSYLQADVTNGMDPGSMEGFFMLRGGIAEDEQTFVDLTIPSQKLKVINTNCEGSSVMALEAPLPTCLHTEHKHMKKLYPKHIMTHHSTFSKIVRSIYYGSSRVRSPKPSYESLVPNIAHLIWYCGSPIRFTTYLTILSLLYIVKVDMVYVHGNCKPTGQYWVQLKKSKEVGKKIIYIDWAMPSTFFQNTYPEYEKPLFSDFLRTEILLKYGGIYSDADAVWVKGFSEEERAYEVTASFDWIPLHEFPEGINTGISLSKKNARFWQLMQEGMRKDNSDLHGYTGVLLPYKIWEKHPETVRIDPHIQVICADLKCHPTWVRDFHNWEMDHTKTGSLKNWRTDVHAFHWTRPDPPEFSNITTLLKAKGMFADVGKMVLSAAGLLK